MPRFTIVQNLDGNEDSLIAEHSTHLDDIGCDMTQSMPIAPFEQSARLHSESGFISDDEREGFFVDEILGYVDESSSEWESRDFHRRSYNSYLGCTGLHLL